MLCRFFKDVELESLTDFRREIVNNGLAADDLPSRIESTDGRATRFG